MNLVEQKINLLAGICLIFLGVGCKTVGEMAYGSKLHEAAALGNLDRLKILSQKNNFDVNARNKQGKTPLHWSAMRQDSSSLIIFLLDKGADINAFDNTEHTPLHYAVIMNNAEAALTLINEGAEVNTRAFGDKTPLHASQLESITKALIANGADVTARTSRRGLIEYEPYKEKGMHKSLYKSMNDQSEKRLEMERYTLGSTPLHLAAMNGRLEIVADLLENGANISEKTIMGNTPLHMAYFNRDNGRIIEFLTTAGADKTIVNQKNEDPVEAGASYQETVAMYIKATKDVTAAAEAAAAQAAALSQAFAAAGASLNSINTSLTQSTSSSSSGTQKLDQSAFKTQQRLENYHSGRIFEESWRR